MANGEEFGKYRIAYGHFSQGVKARINLYAPEGHHVGRIDFLEEGAPLLKDPCGDDTEITLIRFPISRFMDVITILLHEKPLFIFDDKETCLCYISTESEPVGEQEAEAM